jgi:hypothetical protein
MTVGCKADRLCMRETGSCLSPFGYQHSIRVPTDEMRPRFPDLPKRSRILREDPTAE